MGSEYTSDDLEAVETARRLVRKYAPGDVTRTPFQIDAYTVARALLSVREKTANPSLRDVVNQFADATDYNLTCWDACGEGPIPAGVQELYELGRQARKLISPDPIRSLSRE